MTMALELATFAGGCFWCMQPPYDDLDGVITTTVGYCGGHTAQPSYQDVCSGSTGHAEAVQIEFDPNKVSYQQLLDVFWRNIDPTTVNRQFADSGDQYRTAIFYHSQEQKQQAEQSKQQLAASGRFNAPIVTEIVPAATFYPAEQDHQHYYQREPRHYQYYSVASGRKPFLQATWPDSSTPDTDHGSNT